MTGVQLKEIYPLHFVSPSVCPWSFYMPSVRQQNKPRFDFHNSTHWPTHPAVRHQVTHSLHLSAFPHLPISPSYMLTFRHCYMFYCVTRTQPVTVEEKSERVNVDESIITLEMISMRSVCKDWIVPDLEATRTTPQAPGTTLTTAPSRAATWTWGAAHSAPYRWDSTGFYRFLPSLDNWKTDYSDWDGTTQGGCT